MKSVLSTVLATSLMSIGLVGVSATDAFAKGGPNKSDDSSTSVSCENMFNVDNVYSNIAPYTGTYLGCERGTTKNDSNSQSEVEGLSLWDNEVTSIGWDNKDLYKIDVDSEYNNGPTSVESNLLNYTLDIVGGGGGSEGTVTFDENVNYQFAMVLKTSTEWSAYFFDGIEKGTVLDWNTMGVALDGSGNAGKGLSHISFYVSDVYVDLNNNMNYEPKVRVPEPSSIAALAFIGGGMFLSRRRQSH
ncbi:PEP-CTERM sorting domain-containing protein [Dapis sp. BLCC M126]|uniref:PEP-CTERM sorting domain-containing protein n=1 Tax=Dapis sp. BLCC M126 TaxID=3400189 RepID=UPI003CE6702C